MSCSPEEYADSILFAGFATATPLLLLNIGVFPDDQTPIGVCSLQFANICHKKRPAPNANSRYERQLQRSVKENTLKL
jgi:hypothetical protein